MTATATKPPVQPVTEPAFVDDYLGYLLARAAHLFNAQAHAEAKRAGLSVAEWRVLATLSSGRPMTIGELADVVLYQQPTLTKALDRIERKGHVRREGSRNDRRVVHVTITPSGLAAIAPVLKATKRLERAFLDTYPPEEEALLKAALRTLIDRCGASGGDGGAPGR